MAQLKKISRGRPPHIPTEENKKIVLDHASVGITHEDIATKLKIDADTLKKYYKYELQLGRIDATKKVAKSLYQSAISGNLGAQIFWLKTRAGWKETDRKEVVGDNGGDVQIKIISAIQDEE